MVSVVEEDKFRAFLECNRKYYYGGSVSETTFYTELVSAAFREAAETNCGSEMEAYKKSLSVFNELISEKELTGPFPKSPFVTYKVIGQEALLAVNNSIYSNSLEYIGSNYTVYYKDIIELRLPFLFKDRKNTLYCVQFKEKQNKIKSRWDYIDIAKLIALKKLRNYSPRRKRNSVIINCSYNKYGESKIEFLEDTMVSKEIKKYLNQEILQFKKQSKKPIFNCTQKCKFKKICKSE